MPIELCNGASTRYDMLRLHGYVRSEDILAALRAAPKYPDGLIWDMRPLDVLDVPPEALPELVAAIRDLSGLFLPQLWILVNDDLVYDFAYLLRHLFRIYANHTIVVERPPHTLSYQLEPESVE